MTKKYVFILNERGAPKQRPAWYRGKAVTPKKTRDYESLLAELFTLQMRGKEIIGADTPIKITVRFIYKVPKSWSQTKQEKALNGELYPIGSNIPDVDNACKSLLDGMNKVVYVDDKVVVELNSSKKYGTEDQIIVVIESAN